MTTNPVSDGSQVIRVSILEMRYFAKYAAKHQKDELPALIREVEQWCQSRLEQARKADRSRLRVAGRRRFQRSLLRRGR